MRGQDPPAAHGEEPAGVRRHLQQEPPFHCNSQHLQIKKGVKGQIQHTHCLSCYSRKPPIARHFCAEHCWWQESTWMVPGPKRGPISTQSTPTGTNSLGSTSPSHPTLQPHPRCLGHHGQDSGHTSTSPISTCSPSQSSIHGKCCQVTGERKHFLFIPLDDCQARRAALSTPSHGVAPMSHSGCCIASSPRHG